MVVKQEEFEKRYGPVTVYEVRAFKKSNQDGTEEPFQEYLYVATPDRLGHVLEEQDPSFYQQLRKADRIVIEKSPISNGVKIDGLTLERIADMSVPKIID